MIPAFSLTAAAWTALFALGVALAGLGWEYRRRPVFSDPHHWTNDIAYAVMAVGRAITFTAVLLFVAGQVVT